MQIITTQEHWENFHQSRDLVMWYHSAMPGPLLSRTTSLSKILQAIESLRSQGAVAVAIERDKVSVAFPDPSRIEPGGTDDAIGFSLESSEDETEYEESDFEDRDPDDDYQPECPNRYDLPDEDP